MRNWFLCSRYMGSCVGVRARAKLETFQTLETFSKYRCFCSFLRFVTQFPHVFCDTRAETQWNNSRPGCLTPSSLSWEPYPKEKVAAFSSAVSCHFSPAVASEELSADWCGRDHTPTREISRSVPDQVLKRKRNKQTVSMATYSMVAQWYPAQVYSNLVLGNTIFPKI